MEKGAWIRDIKAGQQISGIFLASDAQLAKTKTNRPYWRLRLSDASGDMDAKIWQPLCDRIQTIADGAYVLISGNASPYNNVLQLSLTAFTELSQEERQELHLADFLKSSARDIDAMFQSLRVMCCNEFTHEPWRKLTLRILDDAVTGEAFRTAPAARNLHHNWAGGLLEHTCGVFNLCAQFATSYPELDRQTLLAGALLHDIGKTRELSIGPNTIYTSEGELLGHIMLGLQLIEPFLAKSGLEPHLAGHLRHLILSHHGQLDYGSPVVPKTAEAIALHYADNLDAKLAQCRQLLKNTPLNECTTRQNNLKRALFNMQHTPDGASVNSPIATEAEMIKTGAQDGPPLESYEDYIPHCEPPDDYEIMRDFWADEEMAEQGKHKHGPKKVMKAERCSLV